MAIPKDSLPSAEPGRPTETGYVAPEELERLLAESAEAVEQWEAEHGPVPEEVLAEVGAKLTNARPAR